MSISLRYSSLRCISMTNSSKSAVRKQDMKECVCAQLHFIVRREMGVKLDKEYWCEHVQNSVIEGTANVLRKKIRSDIAIHNNKQDIIISDNE